MDILFRTSICETRYLVTKTFEVLIFIGRRSNSLRVHRLGNNSRQKNAGKPVVLPPKCNGILVDFPVFLCIHPGTEGDSSTWKSGGVTAFPGRGHRERLIGQTPTT